MIRVNNKNCDIDYIGKTRDSSRISTIQVLQRAISSAMQPDVVKLVELHSNVNPVGKKQCFNEVMKA